MIHVTKFAGVRPALADRSLAAEYAATAHNAVLRDGSLSSARVPKLLRTDDDPIKAIYRPGSGDGPAPVLTFPFAACVTQGPMPGSTAGWGHVVVWPLDGVNDPFWHDPDTGGQRPLFVPPPTRTLSVAGITGWTDRSTEPDERSYTYTWVNYYGVESPPAPPSTPRRVLDGQWIRLGNFSTPPADAVAVRIYRSGALLEDGKNAARTYEGIYTLVEEVAVSGPLTTYDDTRRLRDCEGGMLLTIGDRRLPEPPEWVALTEKGNYVAIAGRNVYVSEPHEPWNWPERLRLELPDVATGLAVFGDSAFIGTAGCPFRVDLSTVKGVEEGVLDTQLSVHKYLERYPCLQRWSMVATSFGALYVSARGLVALRPRGPAALISKPRIDEDRWPDYVPNLVAWHNGRLYGTRSPAGRGLVFDVQEDSEGGLELGDVTTIDLPAGVLHAGGDGRLYFAEGTALRQYGAGATPATYEWKSKVYEYGNPTSMAAVQVIGVHGVPTTVRLYGDGLLLYEGTTNDNRPQRLPLMGKCRSYQFALLGTSKIDEVRIASSVADLAAMKDRK